jgi:DNA-binding CsgD family transcriptional regulator
MIFNTLKRKGVAGINLIVLILFLSLSAKAEERTCCKKIYEISLEEYRKGNFIKSLEYLQEAESLAFQNSRQDIRAKSLNMMGLIHTHIHNYDRATHCYLEAHKITTECKDKITEMSVLSNMAQLYFVNNDFVRATEYIDKAYSIAQGLKDTIRMGRIAINASILANETGQLDKADEYTKLAIENLKDAPEHLQSLKKAKLEKLRTLYLQGKHDEAKCFALDLSSRIDEITFVGGKALLYLWLSRIYWQEDNVNEAVAFANRSLEEKPDLDKKIQVFEHLSNIYKQKHFPLLALQFQDSLLAAKDSLSHINNVAKQENMQIRIDLIHSEKELNENKAKRKTERTIFIFIIIITIILIFMLRQQMLRSKQRKSLELEIEKKEKQVLRQKLETQETIAMLEQERLNNEINEKNRQLAAKVLLQSNKNELIEEVIKKLRLISKQTKNQDLDMIIQQLYLQSKETSEWDSFLTYFEQINPSFLALLKEKHADLSPGDVRLLSYIYINLDTKEIASLLNITPEHCRKKKQRLAKKIGVTTNDIYAYLVGLE